MEEMIGAIAEALESSGVPHVVIGGIAASVWGRPRMTLDVDIVIVISPDDAPGFLAGLQRRGFQVTARTPGRLSKMLPAKVRYGKRFSVDLRIASYSLDNQALGRATPVKVLGARLAIASKEDTIVYKAARFNDLDRADIKAIILRWRNKLDRQYILTSCQRLVEETGDPQIARNLDELNSWF